jgi:hypothetical protein
VTNLPEIAKGVVDAGADALALINTVLGMVINLETMKPHLGGKTGGLSGPAIRPIAVRAIYQVHAALPHTPILGMGGAASGRQSTAAESLDSGGCRYCNRNHDECNVCQYCLRCDHDDTKCPHVGVAAADAVPVYPRYICPRCQQEGSHWAVHCKKLPEDLLHQRFRNKSSNEVQAMARKPAKGRSKGNGKSDVASFGHMVDGTLQRFFKKVGKDAVKNPSFALK